MSEPVTNVEIEDVLSSIRRLVSTDDRPKKDDSESTGNAPDKLVLTPSLRVTEEETTPEVDAGTATQDDVEDIEDVELQTERSSLDQAPDAEFDDAETNDITSDGGTEENAEVSDVWVGSDDTEDQHLDVQDDAQDASPMAEDSPVQDSDVQADQSDDQPETLGARTAGFEEAVAARDDEWEPDGTDDEDLKTSSLPWRDHLSDENNSDHAVDENEGLQPYEAEDESEYDYEPEPAAIPSAAQDTNEFRTEDDPLNPGEAILDEEALRDLVAEIVRQELQGALGERITRNVRKLVRREIHRALAAQELE